MHISCYNSMRIPRYLCISFAALLVLLAERDACAQWKNVAQNIIWDGYHDLWNCRAIV